MPIAFIFFAIVNFYPRPPGGGRHQQLSFFQRDFRDFYPRPPGGGRRVVDVPAKPAQEISIHALRVEGDLIGKSAHRHGAISIHALRVEGDYLC